MSVGGRAGARSRFLRRLALIAAALALIALLLLASGHWLVGIIVGAVAVGGIWLLLQTRTVR
jgi:hypothetical protein